VKTARPELCGILTEHVCGVRKVWHTLNRQGHVVARCAEECLTREPGITGVL
jgi:putative transposase